MITPTPIAPIAQLKTGPYGPENCGCTTCLEVATSVSAGKVAWPTPALQQAQILAFRQLVGETQMPPHGIYLADAATIIRSLAPKFAAAGLTAPKCHQVGDQASLISATFDDDDRVAYLHVWYPVIENQRPDLSGQHVAVRFNHAVGGQGLYALPKGVDPVKAKPGDYVRVHLDMANCDGTAGHRARKPGEALYVRIGDPLRDGRNEPGTNVPIGTGPAYWPLPVLRAALSQTRWTDAAGKVHQYGPGLCAAVSVGSVTAIVPPETPAQTIARLTAELAAAKAQAAAVASQLAALLEAIANAVPGSINDLLNELDTIAADPTSPTATVDPASDPGTGVQSGPPFATETVDQ